MTDERRGERGEMSERPLNDFDTCECGDYRLNHFPWGQCAFKDGCARFRLSVAATEIPEAWRRLADTREGPDDHGI